MCQRFVNIAGQILSKQKLSKTFYTLGKLTILSLLYKYNSLLWNHKAWHQVVQPKIVSQLEGQDLTAAGQMSSTQNQGNGIFSLGNQMYWLSNQGIPSDSLGIRTEPRQNKIRKCCKSRVLLHSMPQQCTEICICLHIDPQSLIKSITIIQDNLYADYRDLMDRADWMPMFIKYEF